MLLSACQVAILLTTGRLPSIMAVVFDVSSQEGEMKAAEQYLGNYRLVRYLGEGRSGEVYLGEHVLLTMRAAIKVLYARFTLSGSYHAEGMSLAGVQAGRRSVFHGEDRLTSWLPH
jgi:serine/threonine protein kinase